MNRFTVNDPDGFVVAETIHAAYGAECERRGRPVMTSRMFGRTLRRMRPDTERAQRIVNGVKKWVYLGIDLLHDASVNSVDIESHSDDYEDF